MAIIQKIKSFFTRKGESQSTSDKTEQSSKMEKTNNVDDAKDGNKNVADAQPVGKRTVWQRLKDKVGKTYSDNDILIDAIAIHVLSPLVFTGFMLLAGFVSPYFYIPLGIFFIGILPVIVILLVIKEWKMRRNKNEME